MNRALPYAISIAMTIRAHQTQTQFARTNVRGIADGPCKRIGAMNKQ